MRDLEDHSLLTGEWYLLELNPEPWTASEASLGRRKGKLFINMHKNEQLRAYQEAIKGTMAEEYPTAPLHDGLVELDFFFWRQLPSYVTEAERTARKHQADATNLQKALEDALQGVIFTNDRNVVSVRSTMMEQAANTEPMILIGIHDHYKQMHWPLDKVQHMLSAKAKFRPLAKSEPPPDDDLF